MTFTHVRGSLLRGHRICTKLHQTTVRKACQQLKEKTWQFGCTVRTLIETTGRRSQVASCTGEKHQWLPFLSVKGMLKPKRGRMPSLPGWHGASPRPWSTPRSKAPQTGDSRAPGSIARRKMDMRCSTTVSPESQLKHISPVGVLA